MKIVLASPELEIPFRAEVVRKSLHLVVLVVPYLIWRFGATISLYLLIPSAFLAILGDVLRWRSQWFADKIALLFGFLMRPSEAAKRAYPVLNGATSILIASVIALLCFSPDIAAKALTIAVIADAAAALIGRRFESKTIFSGHATVAGSTAFLIVGLSVSLLLSVPVAAALASVVLATILEALPLPINDNIAVPLALALVMQLV